MPQLFVILQHYAYLSLQTQLFIKPFRIKKIPAHLHIIFKHSSFEITTNIFSHKNSFLNNLIILGF